MRRLATLLILAVTALPLAASTTAAAPDSAPGPEPERVADARDYALDDGLPLEVVRSGESTTGTFTNTYEFPIHIMAYLPHDPDALATTVWWQVWSDEAGEWTSPFVGWCGTGLSDYAIEPGETVSVSLPTATEPGIYRYTLPYFSEEAGIHESATSPLFEIHEDSALN